MSKTIIETADLLTDQELACLISGGRASSLPLRKKKALLIAITYQQHKRFALEGPWRDVQGMSKALKKRFYLDHNIIILSDMCEGADAQPTYLNILHHVGTFLEPNTDHVFVYCGHAAQKRVIKHQNTGDSDYEADFLHEYVLPSDAKMLENSDFNVIPPDLEAMVPEAFSEANNVIFDMELRRLLVKALPDDSCLWAFFDTCHSQTLLNMRHGRCNRVGYNWRCFGRRISRKVVIEPLNWVLGRLSISWPTLNRMIEIHSSRCTGFCPREIKGSDNVVCFSACRDSQVTLEVMEPGTTMLQCVTALLEEHAQPTYKELIRCINRGVESRQACIKKMLAETKDPQHKKYISALAVSDAQVSAPKPIIMTRPVPF